MFSADVLLNLEECFLSADVVLRVSRNQSLAAIMLYLEDFLELIEHLPVELRERCTELRLLDQKVQEGLDQINKAVKEYFEQAPSLSKEEQERRFLKIKEEYKRVKEQQEEKVAIAESIYGQMEKYNQKLHKEIFHFKYELEADNPGITEVIEKRFCEAEKAVIALRKDRRKRSHDLTQGSTSFFPSTSSASKIDLQTAPVRTSQKTAGGSNTDFNQTDHLQNPHTTSGRLVVYDTENPSTSTGAATRNSRCAVNANDRGSDLPPVKVTMKRSSTTNKLVAISNLSATPNMLPSPITGTGSVPPSHTSVLPPKVPSQTGGTNNVGSSSVNSLNSTVAANSSVLNFAGQESRHGRPRKLTPRVQEMLKDNMQRQERRAPTHQGSMEASDEEESDGDQRMYCSCRQKSFGLMVGCDNSGCPFEWFHYDCVKLTQPPKGKWYCPTCSEAMKMSGSTAVEET